MLKVGLPRRRGTRGPGRPENAPLKDFGGKLYDAVFQQEVRDTLLQSLRQTGDQGVGLRLRLRLTDTPELAGMPWEFLYVPRSNRFLALSRRTPLIRYLDLPDPPRPVTVEGPLRLLVMISSPSDYPALDVEREWSTLTGALAGPQADGRVVVERLAANMSVLRERLRREEFHVFHFIGHGGYRSDWGDGVLVMEDADGQSREVTGEELGGLLNEHDLTRLAVLNACEGARSDATDPFAGTAQSLIQQGLPAVVAMQFEITDVAAITFARELYGAIADGYPLDAALAEARGAIRDQGNPTEWATPVLYSRAPDGRLFDLPPRSTIQPAAPVTTPTSQPLRTQDQQDEHDTTTASQLVPLSLASPAQQTSEPEYPSAPAAAASSELLPGRAGNQREAEEQETTGQQAGGAAAGPVAAPSNGAEVTAGTASIPAAGTAPTTRSAEMLSAAGFGILLITFCIDVVTILLRNIALGPRWAIIAASGLGIAVTLGAVRKNAVLASVLLSNLAWTIVYELSIVGPSYSSFSTMSTVLVTLCVIGAVGNGALCIWILALRAKGRYVDPFLALFTGCLSVAYVLAAIAWAALPAPGWPVWNAVGAVLIVGVLVGLLVLLRVLRPGTAKVV